MKILLNILVVLVVSVAAHVSVAAQELNTTIDGVRQGQWRIEGKNGQVKEGQYADGKQVGLWRIYDKDGVLKSEVTYTDGDPIGPATFYFASGNVMEKGTWNMDHWEGDYERYHENGNKACDFTYDNRGRRQGEQIYYHENGNVQYKGSWTAGKIVGALSVYDEQGRKTMERNYSEDGKFQSTNEASTPPSGQKAYENFRGTGMYTLYNLDGTIDRKGQFENGVLIEGTHCVYDEKGKLLYTERVVGGKVQK